MSGTREALEMLERGEALLARRLLSGLPLQGPEHVVLLRELWSFDLFLRLQVAEEAQMFWRADDHGSWLALLDLLRMLLTARAQDLAAHLTQLGGLPGSAEQPRDLHEEETSLAHALRLLGEGRIDGAAAMFGTAHAAADRQRRLLGAVIRSPHPEWPAALAKLTRHGGAVERRVWKASLFKRLEAGPNVLEPSVMRVAEAGVHALLADRGIHWHPPGPPARHSPPAKPSRGDADGLLESSLPEWIGYGPGLERKSRRTRGVGPPPASSEPRDPPLAESPTVRRTPHMELSAAAPLAPGARVEVTVYADEGAAADGEVSAPVEVEMPAGTDRVDIRVVLVPSGHFREEPSQRSFAIERGRPDTERVTFVVTVRAEEELLKLGGELSPLDEAQLMAAFDHRGRPAGFVTRRVKIAISPPDAPTEPVPVAISAPSSPAPTLATSAVGELPDMVVRILPHSNNNGQQFLCSVVAAELNDDGAGDTIEEWYLPQATSELVRHYMEQFVQPDLGARVAALRGAGKELFNAAPENFKRLYWRLVDAGKPPRSIAIVSVEPHIPWELMLPTRATGEGPRRMKPLGVEAMIGRWTRTEGTSGKQAIVLRNSRVIAPTYGDNPLAHAQREAELVTTRFPGSVIRPADVATIGSELSAAGDLTLLHFTCHGSAEGSLQTLVLDNGYKLSSTVVVGMEELEALFERGRTMVFLNACEVGRTNTGLAGVGGFASAFIELGAVAVIAPLWAVRDSIAFEVAKAVYEGIVAEPARPFAEILRELRAKAYDTGTGEDTYAAYCFYGDPLARLVPGA